MVITQLLGGMGNQMFQYALGKHLALINNTELKLDTSILLNWKPGKHKVNRGFDLDIFDLNSEFASRKEIRSYHCDGFSIPEKVLFKLKEKIQGNEATKEKYFHFDPSVLQLSGNIYLSGNWQSFRYFAAIEGEIRKDFSFRLPLSQKALELMRTIQELNSVCLNVRRTDYVSVAETSEVMATVNLEYYNLALKELENKIGEFQVFVFSDDLEWCRTNLSFIRQAVYFVNHTYAGKKFGDYLQLMVACKHYIIPNSTFAWWGAWLNRDPSKIVVAPQIWFKDKSVKIDDLIPPEWIRQ